MVQCKKCLIEAHFVKITAGKRLPEPRGKGTGAEVERRGGRFAGSSENIRPAVVKPYKNRTELVLPGIFSR